jgi:hypothetical protein
MPNTFSLYSRQLAKKKKTKNIAKKKNHLHRTCILILCMLCVLYNEYLKGSHMRFGCSSTKKNGNKKREKFQKHNNDDKDCFDRNIESFVSC